MDTWPNKDPDEVLDYNVDWTNRLQTGETLVDSTFSVVTGTVVIDSEGFTPEGIASVWLSGGTVGEVNEVLNHVTTSQGREYEKTGKLRIRTK